MQETDLWLADMHPLPHRLRLRYCRRWAALAPKQTIKATRETGVAKGGLHARNPPEVG
jgi:hypothetical protein